MRDNFEVQSLLKEVNHETDLESQLLTPGERAETVVLREEFASLEVE